MLNRLRQPKGAVGVLSVIATLYLGILGLAGLVLTLIPSVDFGDERWAAAVICALMILGAIGFLIMDRQPWPGAVLAILGSIAAAIPLFWTIVPIVIGIVFIVVAVMRALAFDSHAAHA